MRNWHRWPLVTELIWRDTLIISDRGHPCESGNPSADGALLPGAASHCQPDIQPLTATPELKPQLCLSRGVAGTISGRAGPMAAVRHEAGGDPLTGQLGGSKL